MLSPLRRLYGFLQTIYYLLFTIYYLAVLVTNWLTHRAKQSPRIERASTFLISAPKNLLLDWGIMTRNEALKQLMTGLIYPAVLGTVFYSVLGALLSPVISMVLGQSQSPIAPWLKWTLVLTTVVFYLCDYLYIMFTRDFRPLFFVCDLALLAGLYVTFMTVDITTPALPHRNLIVVASAYGGFLFLYLIWDVLERRSTHDRGEQVHYNNVIYWEVVSLIVLLFWLGYQEWINEHRRTAPLLAVLLILITIRFSRLAMAKRVFYKAPGTY